MCKNTQLVVSDKDTVQLS